MSAAVAQGLFELPWAQPRADRRRLRGWLGGALLLVGALGAVLPVLPVPESEHVVKRAPPVDLARLVLDPPDSVIPPPPLAVIEPPPPEPPPSAAPEPAPRVARVQPSVADVREKAATSGLLAFRDAFADMRDAADSSRLADTGALARGAGEAATVDRNLLSSRHATRSAGVNESALSRDTGGVALAGRETTRVEAPLHAAREGGVRAADAVDARQRSIEDVRRIFDANKGAIFAIYNRALRSDPALQGKLVLELVIDPSGRVDDVRVIASELDDPDVVAKIVSRIRLFDFGRRDVRATTISYPIHFLPS